MAVEIEKALLLVIALFLRMDLRHHSLRKSNYNLAGRFCCCELDLFIPFSSFFIKSLDYLVSKGSKQSWERLMDASKEP